MEYTQNESLGGGTDTTPQRMLRLAHQAQHRTADEI